MENPLNTTSSLSPTPTIATSATLEVRGSAYDPGYTRIVSPEPKIVVGISCTLLN
jgi:hypothetical protein